MIRTVTPSSPHMRESIFLSSQVFGTTDSQGARVMLFWVFITNQITYFQSIKVTEKNLGNFCSIGLWGGTAGWALKSGGENVSIDQQVESTDFKKNPNNTRIRVIIQSYVTEYSLRYTWTVQQALVFKSIECCASVFVSSKRTQHTFKIHAYNQHIQKNLFNVS